MSQLSGDQLKDLYKNTVNLPKTDFPMKGNLPQTEPQVIERWKQEQIYHRMVKRNEGKTSFILPDGPPYANGYIHMGTALNKTIKDFIIKYANMSGKHAPYIPGWDCHGLPIEHKVTKALGPKRQQMTDADIRALCRKEALTWVDRQREQFIRLGVMGDWENPYLTLKPEFEAEEVRELARILRKGVLYRGEKPVYWCPVMQTALAEAEVEYHPHRSPSIYVKFPLQEELHRVGSPSKPVSLVIWTTTPWTLPANLGVALHPDFDYELFDAGDEYIIIAQKLREAVEADTGLKLTSTGKVFKGAELELMKARHPFYDRESLIVMANYVSADAGTGAVHTAPGHGQDDYNTGLKYGMPILSPVDVAGKYTDEVPEYKGKGIFESNPVIVERLREAGKLLGFKEIEHSYPHNWRSKTPLIFRATPQWFVRMDGDNYNVRKLTLEAIGKLKFVPKWGERRLRSMVENRPDWCLTRQRAWGVPLPVFYCKNCGEALAKPEIMDRVADRMEKEDGIEAYFRTPEAEFTHGESCSKCGGTEFNRGMDIVDVWVDSGCVHAAVLKRYPGMKFPADIYMEGSDQHRGWFQSSLVISVAVNGVAPYKGLVTHGFITDEQGRKMSKSLGNTIDPIEIIKKSGAEILRLWVAHEDFGQDLTCGMQSFDRITETYRRMRNTVRFMLGNLQDFDPVKDPVAYSHLLPLDQWCLAQLNSLIVRCTEAYENYEYYKVYHALNNFFTVDLSATYLDVLKDRLYTFKSDGPERRSAQTVIYHLTHTLTGLIAPILSFLAEETYKYLPGAKAESVFLTDFPKTQDAWTNEKITADFAELIAVRSEVSRVLEELRQAKQIGASLEAQVNVTASAERFQVLKRYESSLPELFIVSKVSVAEGEFKVHAQKALGEKCVRCWNYSEQTGQNANFPGTCPKCWKALDGQKLNLEARA